MGQSGVLIRGARCIDPANDLDQVGDLWVHPQGIVLNPQTIEGDPEVLDGTGLWVMPGLIDLQVHFREPGFEYKETIESGSAAALAGGITTVVVMPNTRPALDTPDRVAYESEESERVNGIRILVAAAATQGIEGEALTDHGALKGAGAVAITDDGMPVMDAGIMEGSLRQCKEHDLLFMQHAENIDMTGHAPMTQSPVSEEIGVRGQPSDAEGDMVERDVALVEKTGARYHVLHTTTARSIRAVRAAKAKGLPVSCEVSPHHLLLTYEACSTADPNTKMNPPLRSEADRQALILAMADGTADAVATDHAPHSANEKARGFVEAPFGVIGLETAFAAVMEFVHDGTISPNRAVELMTSGPARVLKLSETVGSFTAQAADVTLVDPNQEWVVQADDFKGRSKNSAFIGRKFKGRVVATVMRGDLRYSALA
jgi:dihydroorotase